MSAFLKIFVIGFLFLSSLSYCQVFMDGDSTGDAYARIDSKDFGYEVPDCVHPVRHITEEWNTSLKKYVFVFTEHVHPDNDRCINFDRQRTEIKTWGSSPDSMKGFYGDTVTSRWKFKLDALFQPSPSFTHIHQIKPGDGPNADNPHVTVTLRYKNSGNTLQIILGTLAGNGTYTTAFETQLAPLLGVWVDLYEKIKYDSVAGTYSLVIKRVDNEQVLVNFSKTNFAMWRTGSTFLRPKWGIYRSLNDSSYLRDENILFTDFSLLKGNALNLPASCGNLKANASGNIIDLSWSDNSNNEDQLRIDRSIDSLSWLFLAYSPAGISRYSDTLSSAGIYYYRVRAENTVGNSGWSNIVKVNTKPSGIKDNGLLNFNIQQNYPNPFNPSTTINYQLAMSGKIKLTVLNILGREIDVLVNREQQPGSYSVNFDAAKYKLSSGIYFYRIEANSFDGKNNSVITKRMMLLK